MPYRSKDLLQQWVREFAATGGTLNSVIEVLRHDGGAGTDTGLVVMRMADLPADVYLHPVAPGNPKWEVNFGPRERDLTMNAGRLRNLARELTEAAALCEFFELKSTQHAAKSGRTAVQASTP
ncbi:hypothetical protein [Arthrobacter sedimenti]|uniref:hypothetical protein n=1 Tax=Arthrobacter sedimenti TaxID=2694931 RepID=UPI000B350D6F|nr:hypothetical protein [Arthrobacter sedimenti]OUM40021.1 hypothetical protein B8W73_16585 [Arthrobacter agilis]